MKKKIAVLVRDRTHEALRMSVGATLANDEVTVFVMEDKLESDEEIGVNLQMLSDLSVSIYTNNPENRFEFKSDQDIAAMLADCDIVVPY